MNFFAHSTRISIASFIVGTLVLPAALSLIALNASAQSPAAVPPPPKKSPWEAAAALGATMTRGNSETLLVNGSFLATRKEGKNEFRLGLDGTYGEQTVETSSGNDETQTTTEQLKSFIQYNRVFGEADHWFGYGRGEYVHDAIADILARITLGPGLGYYIIKKQNLSLSAEVGPAWVNERRYGQPWDDYFTLRAAERFEYKLSGRTKIWQTLEWLPQVDRLSNYLLNFEAGIDSDITPRLGLRFVFQDTYDNEPVPDRKSNDLKLIAGLRYKFL